MREPTPGSGSHRLRAKRARLIADGHKAIAMINAGRDIAECLMIIDGSRARLYRAITAASNGRYSGGALPGGDISGRKPIDPLLL